MDEFEQQLAREREWEARALQVQAQAAQAYLRLVDLAERSDTGQAGRVARFLASTYQNGARTLLTCSTCACWTSTAFRRCADVHRCTALGQADLYKLLPDGERRIAAVITLRGLDKFRPHGDL